MTEDKPPDGYHEVPLPKKLSNTLGIPRMAFRGAGETVVLGTPPDPARHACTTMGCRPDTGEHVLLRFDDRADAETIEILALLHGANTESARRIAAQHEAGVDMLRMVAGGLQPGRPARKQVNLDSHRLHLCFDDHCTICLRGRAVCVVCGCGEATLPTDCPKTHVGRVDQAAIYVGVRDFRAGAWVDMVMTGPTEPTPHVQDMFASRRKQVEPGD